MSKRTFIIFATVFGLGAVFSILALAQAPGMSPDLASSAMDNQGVRKYRVGPGDLLDVRVFGQPDLNSTVEIDEDGNISSLPFIEDPIPAGCEQIAHISGINLNYSEGKWSDWYSNREFRDNRTVIFKNYFDGKATFQYAMRVEVPGDFRVAPARAELMYQPTVQANTSNGQLRILDKK